MSKWSFGDATLALQSIAENGIPKKVAKNGNHILLLFSAFRF